MKKKTIFTILIILVYTFNSFCQEKDTINNSVNDSTKILLLKNQSNISELDYYKLLYENSNKNNEAYVSLIQWSLGLSFAFLLAIIGSQIFFNYRISKKEIISIRKDLEERISELKNTLTENIEDKFNSQNLSFKKDFEKTEKQLNEKIEIINSRFSGFKSEIKSDFDKTEKQLNEKIEIINSRFSDFKSEIKSDFDKNEIQLNEKIEIINNRFSDFKSEIKSDFDKSEIQFLDKINNQFDSKSKIVELQIKAISLRFTKEIKSLNNDIIKNTGHLWELRGVSANALTRFIDSALLQIELKREVKYILDDLIKTLTKVTEIHITNYENLDLLTEKIKETHKKYFDEIKGLYISKSVYTYENGKVKYLQSKN
jgi:hypothetical protein